MRAMQRPLDINDLAFLLDMTARGVSDMVRDGFFPKPTWVSTGRTRLWDYQAVETWGQEHDQAVRTLDELENHIAFQRRLGR